MPRMGGIGMWLVNTVNTVSFPSSFWMAAVEVRVDLLEFALRLAAACSPTGSRATSSKACCSDVSYPGWAARAGGVVWEWTGDGGGRWGGGGR